jgi:hypothetical protein
MVSWRNLATGALRLTGHAGIAAALRRHHQGENRGDHPPVAAADPAVHPLGCREQQFTQIARPKGSNRI